MSDLLGLAGKKALVVGGGRGMGRASAELLSEAGADVGVVDVVAELAEDVARALRAEGRVAVPIVADVLQKDGAEGAVVRAAAELGGLDVLVHVVGMASWSALLDLPEETLDLDLTRNFRYVLWSSRAFARLPRDPERGGAIVNIASISGLLGAPNHAAYGAAKAGLMGLTRSMALEWAALGIRANCIAPGSIRTDRSAGTPEVDARAATVVPMGRRGDQREVAKAALFLASDLASYVTGQTLIVDGGALIRFPFF